MPKKTTTPPTQPTFQDAIADPRLLDKSWRMSHLYKIRDKEDNLVTFSLNEAQADFEKNRHTRNIILKSRQLGFTTYEAIDCLDDALFNRNFTGLIIAHEQDPALDIFEGKVSLAWENFPLQQLYSVDADRANKLRIGFGDGTYSGVAVKTSGRSGTNSRVHVSEFAKICAKYPNKAKEILTGTVPSVPLHGRLDIESTAEGEVGEFHDMFWKAWNRQTPPRPTEYKAHFYNWTWDKAEIEKSQLLDVPQEFKDYQIKHNLSDKEISYYFQKYLGLNEDKKLLRQEYPTTPEEAFLSSGDKVFDVDKLKLQVKEPYEMVGNWKVYKKYNSSHRYGMGADVSEGVGGDSSTAVIWDFTKSEIVATFSDNRIPPDLFAHELRTGGNLYGGCIIAPERNNHGHATIVILKSMYSNIFKERKMDTYLDRETEKLGWHTNSASKPKMIYDLSSAINEELVKINSADVLSELITYDRNDMIKEDDTKHWDLVIAAAIGWQMNAYAQNKIINQFNKKKIAYR